MLESGRWERAAPPAGPDAAGSDRPPPLPALCREADRSGQVQQSAGTGLTSVFTLRAAYSYSGYRSDCGMKRIQKTNWENELLPFSAIGCDQSVCQTPIRQWGSHQKQQFTQMKCSMNVVEQDAALRPKHRAIQLHMAYPLPYCFSPDKNKPCQQTRKAAQGYS